MAAIYNLIVKFTRSNEVLREDMRMIFDRNDNKEESKGIDLDSHLFSR